MTAEADVAEPRRDHGEHVRLLTERSDRMAQRYERYWSPVILPMARPLLDTIAPVPGQRTLDLATGTGALLSDLSGGGATQVGADRSLGMLRIARQRNLVPLACMYAHDLALVDQSAHVVVAAFVLFHLPDPARALSEIRRVLKPAGVAAVVIWGEEPTYPANGYRWQRLESLEETARSELIEQLHRQASELPDAAFIYRPRDVYGVARRT